MDRRSDTMGTPAVSAAGSVICFGGFETVKSLSLENEMASRFDKAQKKQIDAVLRENRITVLLTPLTVLGRYLSQFFTGIYRRVFYDKRKAYAGSACYVSRAIILSLTCFGNIAGLVAAIRRLSVSAERIVDLWNVPAEQSGGEKAMPDTAAHAVVFNGVSFGYDGGNQTLKNVSLSAKKGSFTALVGESGCSKSTVLKLAAGFYEPVSGENKIFGRDAAEWEYTDNAPQHSLCNPGYLPWRGVRKAPKDTGLTYSKATL